MNRKKYEIYLSNIKKIYPDKIKLNKTQYCRVKGISLSTFATIIKSKNFKELPPFKVKEKQRKNGTIYRSYEFDVYDVALFLAS